MKYMVALCALLIVLFASMAMAVVGTDDGLAGPTAGTSPNPDYVPTVAGNTMLNYWVETSGGYTHFGIYDGDDYKWIPEGSDAGTIAVKALIEMWCEDHLDKTNVVFHQAGPGATQFVDIAGYLKSNNGQFWGVSKNGTADAWGQGDKAKADNLFFVKDVLSRNTTPNTPSIPIKWELADNAGFRTGDWSGGNNEQDWGYWWLLNNGATGMNNFVLRITITPSTYQDDGIYELDPAIVAQPAL